jgi:hypothetical protein
MSEVANFSYTYHCFLIHVKQSTSVSAKIQYYIGPFQMSRNNREMRGNSPQDSTLLRFVGFRQYM